jgi:hypothetical protein
MNIYIPREDLLKIKINNPETYQMLQGFMKDGDYCETLDKEKLKKECELYFNVEDLFPKEKIIEAAKHLGCNSQVKYGHYKVISYENKLIITCNKDGFLRYYNRSLELIGDIEDVLRQGIDIEGIAVILKSDIFKFLIHKQDTENLRKLRELNNFNICMVDDKLVIKESGGCDIKAPEINNPFDIIYVDGKEVPINSELGKDVLCYDKSEFRYENGFFVCSKLYCSNVYYQNFKNIGGIEQALEIGIIFSGSDAPSFYSDLLEEIVYTKICDLLAKKYAKREHFTIYKKYDNYFIDDIKGDLKREEKI